MPGWDEREPGDPKRPPVGAVGEAMQELIEDAPDLAETDPDPEEVLGEGSSDLNRSEERSTRGARQAGDDADLDEGRSGGVHPDTRQAFPGA